MRMNLNLRVFAAVLILAAVSVNLFVAFFAYFLMPT